MIPTHLDLPTIPEAAVAGTRPPEPTDGAAEIEDRTAEAVIRYLAHAGTVADVAVEAVAERMAAGARKS